MFRKNIILESFQAAWKIFIITLSLARGQTPTLSISPSTIEIGSNYTLVCDVQINNAIKFFLDGNEQSNCPPPFIGGPCTPSDIVQGTGLTSWTRTATIAHVGNWTCARSNIESNVIVVEAYQCPDTVLSESGISANLELNGSSLVDITAKIACIYPTTNLDFQLQLIPSSGNTLSTNMICTLSASSCTLGSAYDCSHQISDEIEFVQEMKYTVHVKAAPLSQSCEPLALFYPYTLTFKSTGFETKTITEQTSAPSSISATDSSHYSTFQPGKGIPESVSKTTTDRYITTSNISTPPETKSMLSALVISLSVVTFCLVGIFIVAICVVYYKRHSKEQKSTGHYSDPQLNEGYLYQGAGSNHRYNGKENVQSQLNKIQSSPEFAVNYSKERRNIQQRDQYETDRIRVYDEADRRRHKIEMVCEPHVQYRKEHFRIRRQPGQINNSNDYFLNHDRQRSQMMRQHGHYYSFPNYSFY